VTSLFGSAGVCARAGAIVGLAGLVWGVLALSAHATSVRAPDCESGSLRLGYDGRSGASGRLELFFGLRNVGSGDCRLFGFPGVRFIGHRGHQFADPVAWRTFTYFGSTPRNAVRLRPGASADFTVEIANVSAGRCARYAHAISIYAPNSTRSQRVGVQDSVLVCGDKSVTPVFAARP
jgi:hypothetical protein